jgi:acyl-CoA thioesterase
MTDEEAIRQLEESSGFIKHNHFHVVEVDKGKQTILEVKLTEDALNPYGFAHGGLIFGLGDTAMGITVRSTGRNAVTLTSSITYLRPSLGNTLRAEAEMIKDGKHTSYLKCNFYDEEEKLTASMDASYYYTD